MKKKSGTSYFKDLSRKDYVELASRIIKEEGVGAVSIRRMAAELGCSSASMYRYFDNLDELLFYAQLDALNEYILDLSIREHFIIFLQRLSQVPVDIAVEHGLKGFRVAESLGCIGTPYAEMYIPYVLPFLFPDAIIRVSPMIKEMLEIPGYYDRDYYVCRRIVKEGKITEENARRLNHILCTLFLGYFKFVQEHGVEPETIPGLVDRFISESKEITQLYASDFIPR